MNHTFSLIRMVEKCFREFIDWFHKIQRVYNFKQIYKGRNAAQSTIDNKMHGFDTVNLAWPKNGFIDFVQDNST